VGKARQSSVVMHPHVFCGIRQRGPGPQAVLQFSHCPPDPPHVVSTLPWTQFPPVCMFVQQPPLHAVFSPPQSCWQVCRKFEHAFSVGQSAATLHPHRPPTQADPALCDAQLLHAPPFVPQAVPAVPGTHVPPEQQPPLHVCVGEHEVVHWEPLHA
jgi:hypothetical protein